MKDIIIILLIIIVIGLTAQNKRLRTNQKEYQIELEMDSASVYDNGRYVGSYQFLKTDVKTWTGIDSIFAYDNQ